MKESGQADSETRYGKYFGLAIFGLLDSILSIFCFATFQIVYNLTKYELLFE